MNDLCLVSKNPYFLCFKFLTRPKSYFCLNYILKLASFEYFYDVNKKEKAT